MAKKIEWTVEMADKQIEKWQIIKNIILRSKIQSGDSLDTKVFKLYLKLTSVADVARALSDDGVRIPSSTGSRKLISNDISDIIRTHDIEDLELQQLVRNIHNDATKFMNTIYN